MRKMLYQAPFDDSDFGWLRRAHPAQAQLLRAAAGAWSETTAITTYRSGPHYALDNVAAVRAQCASLHYPDTPLTTSAFNKRAFGLYKNGLGVLQSGPQSRLLIRQDVLDYVRAHRERVRQENARWEAKRALDPRERIGVLEDALAALHAVQNGPPLIRDADEWLGAMDKADAALGLPSGRALREERIP